MNCTMQELAQSAMHAAAIARPAVHAAQVTSLALCKHNKNDLLLMKLRQHVRHGPARSMFWRYNEVPKEALAVLEVRLKDRRMCMCACNVAGNDKSCPCVYQNAVWQPLSDIVGRFLILSRGGLMFQRGIQMP